MPDANGGSTLIGAANWVQAVIEGPLVTGLAVLAIASLGLAMLTGRMALRRGATVVLGCFILIGAPAIARGIVAVATDRAEAPVQSPLPAAELSAPLAVPPVKEEPAVSDPYAGASVRK